MNEEEAGRLLREMYDDPATGRVVAIHLFGIRYEAALRGLDAKTVAGAAGIPVSYAREIQKGMSLAAHVTER